MPSLPHHIFDIPPHGLMVSFLIYLMLSFLKETIIFSLKIIAAPICCSVRVRSLAILAAPGSPHKPCFLAYFFAFFRYFRLFFAYLAADLTSYAIFARFCHAPLTFHSKFSVQGRCWRPPSRQNHHVVKPEVEREP